MGFGNAEGEVNDTSPVETNRGAKIFRNPASRLLDLSELVVCSSAFSCTTDAASSENPLSPLSIAASMN